MIDNNCNVCINLGVPAIWLAARLQYLTTVTESEFKYNFTLILLYYKWEKGKLPQYSIKKKIVWFVSFSLSLSKQCNFAEFNLASFAWLYNNNKKRCYLSFLVGPYWKILALRLINNPQPLSEISGKPFSNRDLPNCK